MQRIAIWYRDFYDVPRLFVALHEEATYLFDCAFDQEADEYAKSFRVYRLTAAGFPSVDGDWQALARQGVLIGEVAVQDVEFDATRRASIAPEVFARIQPPSASVLG